GRPTFQILTEKLHGTVRKEKAGPAWVITSEAFTGVANAVDDVAIARMDLRTGRIREFVDLPVNAAETDRRAAGTSAKDVGTADPDRGALEPGAFADCEGVG